MSRGNGIGVARLVGGLTAIIADAVDGAGTMIPVCVAWQLSVPINGLISVDHFQSGLSVSFITL